MLLSVQFAFGWGSDAHRIINRIAVETLPADVPAFLRCRSAIEEMEYLGSEPDRWRSSAEPELKQAQAPEHFIDLEWADLVEPDGLPAARFQFIRDLERAQVQHPNLAEKLTPESVGLLPWQANEEFERLRIDMRQYRMQLAAHQTTQNVQQAILYDAGILGHYVADGSQPLHTTIDYNGWVETKNPEGFIRQRGIHSEFESQFVHNNFDAAAIRPLVPASPRILDSLFQALVDYLNTSHRQVPELYRLEKQSGFQGRGTAESRGFTAEKIAAGASMLRDMIYTAWMQSASFR